jgi:hypothetical protein
MTQGRVNSVYRGILDSASYIIIIIIIIIY